MNLKGRNFLTLKDFTPEEITYLIDLSKEESRRASRILQRQKYRTYF